MFSDFARTVVLTAVTALSLMVATSHAVEKIEFLTPKPLSEVVNTTAPQAVKPGPLRVPTITWPADTATKHTEMAGIFKAHGLDVELFNENDLAKQVQGLIDGKTPLLRGTLGMMIQAQEAAQKAGIDLIIISQLSWSKGGDALTVRKGIRTLNDLKGKTIVLQLYGPHGELLFVVLNLAGVNLNDVTLRWVKELTLPTYDTQGVINDPRSAFAASEDIHGAMVISPDANALVAGDFSVSGAHVPFSTKTADRAIADVYAVRADWFHKNRDVVEKFVHALMQGQESYIRLMAEKSTKPTQWNALMDESAKLLYGSAQAVPDLEGSLGDCELVGYDGNVQFFTSQGTTRNLPIMTGEIASAFQQLKLLRKTVKLQSANWDYAKLAQGLNNVNVTVAPKFDANKVQTRIEKQIKTELEDGTQQELFSFEIYFAANQSNFSADLNPAFKEAYQKAVVASQTLGGAVITIEGHNSPDLINQKRAEGASQQTLDEIAQAAKDFARKRANAVQTDFLAYCAQQGLKVDATQFPTVGRGVEAPKFASPANKEQKAQNRRVVFRVKTVETELPDEN